MCNIIFDLIRLFYKPGSYLLGNQVIIRSKLSDNLHEKSSVHNFRLFLTHIKNKIGLC